MKKKKGIYLEWISFLLLYHLFRFLPRSWGKKVGRTIGYLFYLFDRRHRQLALKNLAQAFKQEIRAKERKRIAGESFRHFGEMIAEFLKYSSLQPEKRRALVRAQGLEYFYQAQSLQRGVIIISAHYGNWEVASYFLSLLGDLNVVARPLDNPRLEKKLSEIRTSLGAKIIYKHEAARPILRSLKAKEIVVLLIDQNVLEDMAVFVDFFGCLAATTPAAAILALRSQAPILPAFCTPTREGYFLVEFNPPLFPPQEEKDREEQVLQITQRCTKIIESQIRKAPEYWMWFHNRWKTRPPQKNKPPQGDHNES
jgi:KDO2-lipid IV(A) lauroyltransferase